MATEHYLYGQAIAKRLPDDIQKLLKRKSSRDPNSRFARKLHALLSYVEATDPKLADDFGVGWIDDQVFRVFKPRLLGVMGIKLNTLNVNFKNLKFVQLQSDKRFPGWTKWRKDGFTKRTFQLPVNQANMGNLPENDFFNTQVLPVVDKPIELGRVTHEQFDDMQRIAVQEWTEIIDSEHEMMMTCAAGYFVGKAAARYRHPQQTSQNAFEVLRAILTPQDQMEISYADFFRFLAMFGPPQTLMLKIHALLEVATADTPWLYFGLSPEIDDTTVAGLFDSSEPNALCIHNGGDTEKVWNLPLVPAGEEYVEDKDGRKYSSWGDYFREHPVGGAGNFIGM